MFRKGKGGRKRGRGISMCSCTPPTGDLAHNPGMCPDWNQTCNPLIHRPKLNPLSHTSQGHLFIFKGRGREGVKEGE